MKRLLLVIAGCVALAAALECSPATAQDSAGDNHALSAATPTMTPEMWYYMQEMQRHDDPAQAVRRNAEFHAAQRRARLAATKWFGLSNSRPQASVTPFMGTYSPTWAGNGGNPYWWVGTSYGPTAIHIDYVESRR